MRCFTQLLYHNAGSLYRGRARVPPRLNLLASLLDDVETNSKRRSAGRIIRRLILIIPIGILRTRWTDEGNTWRPWRQCILPECLRVHLCPNGPSTECSGSVAAVACVCRVVGMMKDEKQKKKQMSPKVKNIVRASVSNGHG